MKDYYIGVDPGWTGGLAWVDSKGKTAECVQMPKTERDIWDWFTEIPGHVGIIEKVHAMPKQGVSSTFKFGHSYGFLRCALISTDVSFQEVTPRTWQKGLEIPPKKKTETGSQWKQRLKGFAQQLFPNVKVSLKAADSLLIAEFCRRKNEGLIND